jgi:hypothetical protein
LRRNRAMRFRTKVYLSRGIGFVFLAFAFYQAFDLLNFYVMHILDMLFCPLHPAVQTAL